MENVKKLTKNDYFEMIKGLCADREDIVNFCNHEQELLSKKNSNKSTKVTKLNEEITELVVNELANAGKPTTITDLMNNSNAIKDYTYEEGGEVKHLSNQKITSVLNKLVGKTVVKVVDKKKAYFSVAE